MIAIARGSITEPHKLGPFIDDEMRLVQQLKGEGVIKALYRRAAGAPEWSSSSKARAWTRLTSAWHPPLRRRGTHDP
jgi:hypothetical protein